MPTQGPPSQLRRALPALAVAAAVCAALACSGAPPERPAKRNLLVITVDTLRQDHVGAYGGAIETPALDRLAASGFLFADSFAAAPTTLPSHTSLFTGTYPHRHGVRVNGTNRVSDTTVTLAEVLRQSGYSTAAFVGSAVLDSFYGLDQGFDRYDDDFSSDVASVQEQRRAGGVTDAALAWLAAAPEPFFLWVHYLDPHGPYDPPAPFDTRYYSGDPRSPEHESMKDVPVVFYQNLQGVTDLRYPLAQYKGEIGYTDQGIGKILDALDAREAARDTLVVATADHGESLGEHGYYFDHGETLQDVCLRVPLLLRAPWREGAGTVRGPVSLVDLFPTMLSLLEISAPEGVQGEDLTSFLASGRVPDRTVFFESLLPLRSRRPALFGAQTTEWKLVVDAEHSELYHHPSDPGEATDLASQRKAKLNELRSTLRDYVNARPTEGEQIEPTQEQIDKLRALGYVR